MKKKFLVGSFLLMAAVIVSGCADKTQQQYHDQEVKDELAQCQAASGPSNNPYAYNGSISSLDTGTALGGLQLSFQCLTTSTPSPDGTTTDAQVVVQGSAKILRATSSEASFSGSYAPDTNILSGTITISDENLTLNVNATLSDSTLTGQILSANYPGDGGNFTATRNGALPPAQGSSSGGEVTPASRTQYSGTYSGYDCKSQTDSCAVTLTISDTPTSNADSFADAVVNVEDVIAEVDVTINPSGNAGTPDVQQYFFGGGATGDSAQLDERNGLLLGQAPNSEVGNTYKLGCRAIGAADGSDGWFCTLDKFTFRVGSATVLQ